MVRRYRSSISRYKSLFKQFYRLHETFRDKISYFDSFKYFLRWTKSMSRSSSPLVDGRPWLVFSALDFLDTIVRDTMLVFEYGSGGSSVYFAKNAKAVFSVEHDGLWLERTSGVIKKAEYGNWSGLFIEPAVDTAVSSKDFLIPDHYASSLEDFKGKNFFKYASYIDTFENDYFDLIMIDGRARISCFIHAKRKLKKGGYLILDNSERERYKIIHEQLEAEGWVRHNFFGPGPYVNYEFWQTTIWQRK